RARHQPELRSVVDQVGDPGAPDLVLAGQAVDVRAGAADPFPLHDGRPAPRAGQVPGQELAARTAAQDEDLIAWGLRHTSLLSVSRPPVQETVPRQRRSLRRAFPGRSVPCPATAQPPWGYPAGKPAPPRG